MNNRAENISLKNMFNFDNEKVTGVKYEVKPSDEPTSIKILPPYV